jgi:heme oxygenase
MKQHLPASESRSPDPGLAILLRTHTRGLHTRAERSGIVAKILRGEAHRLAYALLLRNLLPVYRELETGLQRNRRCEGVRRVLEPALFRSVALESDVQAISGPSWADKLPLLTEGEAYARRVAASAERGGGGLIAHAYVRYLGDLNGGRVLQGLLSRHLGLDDSELSFYRFDGIADPASFSLGYRQALDQAGAELRNHAAIAQEAATAFRLNIALSEAVAEYA